MVLNHKTEPRKYRNETRKGKRSRRDLPAETREELESRDSMKASFFFTSVQLYRKRRKYQNRRRQRNDF